jgi:hypothetical protein
MKNGGWLDNYNDSQTSAPEGFEGDGFSNVGRDYSPAWGGQFQEGGEIPNAQSGRATRADSLAVFNNTRAIDDYYRKQGYVKEKVKDSKDYKERIKNRKEWVNSSQKYLKEAKNVPVDIFYTQTDKNKNIAEQKKYLKEAQKRLSETIDENNPKNYIKKLEASKKIFETKAKDIGRYVDEQNNLVEGKPSVEKFYSPIDENKFYQREQSQGFLDLRSPMPLYDKRITPQDLSRFKSPNSVLGEQLLDKIINSKNKKEREALEKQMDALVYSDNVEMYEYDPLAVMPFDMVPLEQQEERIRKYGSSGVPTSIIQQHPDWVNSNTKPISNPTKHNVEGLQPMSVGLQNVDNGFETNLDIPTPVQRQPKYYDIRDVNNQRFGGTDTQYRVDSLDELRELPKEQWDRKITPHYQMGGNIYPVNYVPQAQGGKELTFLQPTSDKLPEGYMRGSSIPSTERAMSIGGENGEPAYLIPSFKYGQELLGPVFDPISEFRRTGEHLGGPFKTWQEADEWERTVRHPAVENRETIMFPQEQFQMGGSLPGATGSMYARYEQGGDVRTQGIPSNGPYAKKTMASAQNGKKQKPKNKKMQVLQPGDDFMHHNAPVYRPLSATQAKLQASIDKEANSEALRLWSGTKAHADEIKANKIAEANNIKATVAQRKAVRAKAAANPLNQGISGFVNPDNWTRQNWEDASANLESEFRMSDKPNFYDDNLNPFNMIGGMAADLGAAPNQAKQTDSYMPYVTSIGTPLLTGALEGLGTKNNKQFINNLVNPVNFVPGYHSAERYVGNKIGNNFSNLTGAGLGFKDGGVIQDDMGQWNHPGEITEINSNEITMKPDPRTGKPLTKPLLGISDTGDVKLMRPGGKYKFDGKKVIEYPIAQDGFVDKLKANTAAKKNKIDIRETPRTVTNDNISNAHNMAIKGDKKLVKEIQYANRVANEKAKAQAEAQKKFNALPKKEQERILYDQYNQEKGTISEYNPDSTLNKIGQSMVLPFTAMTDLYQNGEVRDNLISSVINNPKSANAYDAAYLGTLGYAAAPLIQSGVSTIGAAAAPYMAADAVVGGTTLTGINMNNLLAAGFATHGLTNVAPDVKEWTDNPNWDNAGHVLTDALEIAPIVGPGAKMISEGAGYVGNKADQASSYISETAPKVKNFIKDVAGDVKGVYNQYKEINEIKNSTSNPKSLVNTAEGVNHVKDRYINNFSSITNSNEFNSVADDLMWDFEQKLIRMGGKDFADAEMIKWKTSLQKNNPKLFLEVKEMENGTNVPTVDDLQRIGRELSESLPKGENIIPSAKKHLSNVQKKLLFDKSKDFETLKEFTKNIGIKTPKVPKVDYTPKERETIAAIRELGKYRTTARWQKDKLFADPEAMVSINKEILKLDDEVVQNLLGVSKSELLQTYKDIVPSTKKTQVDITSNPIPTTDLSVVDEYNTIQPGAVSEMHPLNEKQLRPVDPKRESLLQRVEQSYAKNFAPINYEQPSSSPQSLISLAKTDYAYEPILDANYNNVLDANGNVTYADKITPQGNVKQQLISALRKVESSPKGTNFIGSGSLSTDSYPLTLESGIGMSKRGLVQVNVQPGTTGLNDMGYTNMSPRLVIKDINSKIEELEKLSGKKLPRAKYNPSKRGTYEMYEVPRIYFTRLKQGGTINKADENSLVKLDQLTNFTNYNNQQPGGWLNKYN